MLNFRKQTATIFRRLHTINHRVISILLYDGRMNEVTVLSSNVILIQTYTARLSSAMHATTNTCVLCMTEQNERVMKPYQSVRTYHLRL
jgi:hypothetical protein